MSNFLKRNSLVFRLAGNNGQPLPRSINFVVNRFLKDIIKARERMNINDEQLEVIINMDETLVFFEMVQSVINELKGTIIVKIPTFGNYKSRVFVILSIAGNGQKL